MVNKLIAALVVGGAAALATTGAQATVFTGTYSVSSFTDVNGTGLDIKTKDVAPGINLNLTAGGPSQTIQLFKIWTTEQAFNLEDDLANQSISVTFSFTAPAPPFGGPVGGTTDATVGFFLIFPVSTYGRVEWNDPIDITFGALGDGLLRVWLSDEEFNKGPLGSFVPGEENGATVEAKFKLIHDATVVVAEVPEPATLALLGMGLLGLGVARRRITR